MQSFMAEILAELPIAVDVVNNETMPTAPHTLNELCLSGIRALIIFPEIDGSMPYAQTKKSGKTAAGGEAILRVGWYVGAGRRMVSCILSTR
jgi:hypothetical protein